MIGIFGSQITQVYAQGKAVFSFVDNEITVSIGELIKVDLIVEPNDEALDTVRAELRFSTDILEAQTFELGDIFSRATPGNQIDNTTGFISEGGFTLEGPVTSSGHFGSITFKTKKEGEGVIEFLSTSKLIASGEEKINGSNLDRLNIIVQSLDAQEQTEEDELMVTSQTHPNEEEWSNVRDVVFEWSVEGDSSITRFYTALDQNPQTNPNQVLSANTTQKIQENIEDGIWFFHLKAQKTNGTFTNTVHYKVQIDSTSPNPIQPSTDATQLNEGEQTILRFGTTDDLSGISRYELSINDGPFVPHASPLTLSNLVTGDYYLKVKAIDRAGNEIYGLTTMRVYPEGSLPETVNDKKTDSGLNERIQSISLLIIRILGIAAVFGIIGVLFVKKKNK